MKILRRIILSVAALVAGACTSTAVPPLTGIKDPVDLPRFMGPWYVIGYIPIHLPPLFSEKDAWNGVESYALESDGSIATTYTFRRGGFDGPEEKFTPRARIANAPVNSEWKMKFFWYLPAGDFLILHLDDAYSETIIGVPDRSFVWIMVRRPDVPDAQYRALLERVGALGYDPALVQRVPQRWD